MRARVCVCVRRDSRNGGNQRHQSTTHHSPTHTPTRPWQQLPHRVHVCAACLDCVNGCCGLRGCVRGACAEACADGPLCVPCVPCGPRGALPPIGSCEDLGACCAALPRAVASLDWRGFAAHVAERCGWLLQGADGWTRFIDEWERAAEPPHDKPLDQDAPPLRHRSRRDETGRGPKTTSPTQQETEDGCRVAKVVVRGKS